MTYEGDVLDRCGVIQVDLTLISVVAVSGSRLNVCGHLLFFTQSRGGYYFHIAGGLDAYPRYMTASRYAQYLREHGKRELRRVPLTLPKPRDAEAVLEDLLADKWFWGVLPHNCVSFCETIIKAGGLDWGSLSNCPVLATDVPQQAVVQFLNGLESRIFQIYGVPR